MAFPAVQSFFIVIQIATAGMMQHLVPAEALESLSRRAVNKARMPFQKLFASSIMAGMLLSFACGTLLIANASPDLVTYTPGLLRLINGLVFPYGLVLIILSGTTLATASMSDTAVALCQRRLRIPSVASTLLVTLIGNAIGSLLVVSFLFGLGGTFDTKPFRESVISYATTKQIAPSWHQIFLRGIGANFLLSVAEYHDSMGRGYVERALAIWMPAAAFISLDLDHVIANMTFIPMAIWLKAPGITVSMYVTKGILPVLLGNFIGGAIFNGAFLWYLHLQDSEPIAIDGKYFDGEERSNSRFPLLGGYSDREQGHYSRSRCTSPYPNKNYLPRPVSSV